MLTSVQVLDRNSSQILFECSIDQLDFAYQKAKEYEEMGLDIFISAPGLAESLIHSLGANPQEINEFKKSLDNEIESHQDNLGCAICFEK